MSNQIVTSMQYEHVKSLPIPAAMFCKDGSKLANHFESTPYENRKKPTFDNEEIDPDLFFLQSLSSDSPLSFDYVVGYSSHCLGINSNGTLKQTSANTKLTLGMIFTEEILPLELYITQPETPVIIPQMREDTYGSHKLIFNKTGFYAIETKQTKIIRAPFPYSNPACVEHNDRRNTDLEETGAVQFMYRNQLKDFVNVSKYELEYKLRGKREYYIGDRYWEHIESCKKACHLPCDEERCEVHVHENYIDDNAGDYSEIYFIKEAPMERLIITESPAYTLVSVIANIGGVLG